MWQLSEVVDGMAEACQALGLPVVGGNVSLYNESGGEPIYPTPIVGVLGLLDDVARQCPCPSRFQRAGDVIALLGETRDEIGASEYLEVVHGLVAGRVPELDLDREAGVQALCREAITQGLLHSAHDCSDGGLAVALAESCSGPFGLPSDDAASDASVIGARVALPQAWSAVRPDAALFGESQSRIVVSLAPEHWDDLQALARRHGVPIHRLGETGGDRLTISPYVDGPLAEALTVYHTALERLLGAAPTGAASET
jgi:phosphoribosylformylglycinamidine synthase